MTVGSDSLVAEFGARLASALDAYGPVCLGIDAHPFLLAEWGLDDSPEGAREFGLKAVTAATGTVGVVKPQVAFFERHGGAGILALEVVIREARDAGLLVIADAKRGDIGSTVDAYGEAWLSPGSPLEADAMTVVAYQGVASLNGVIARALEAEKGLFVLAATSNPESLATQTATVRRGPYTGASIAGQVVNEVAAINTGSTLGSIGVVIGGNVDLTEVGVAVTTLVGTPILAPGYGEQGAVLSSLGETFGVAASGVVANVGRGVLRAGPDGLADALGEAIREAKGAR